MTQRQSYLLRLWKEHDSSIQTEDPLRIVLIDPRTNQKRSFGSLIGLIAFLEEVTVEEMTNDE